MTKIIISIFSVAVLLTSCHSEKKDNQNTENVVENSETAKYKAIFDKKIVVIVKGKINPDSNKIAFQTYINEKNVEFIPVFTSKDELLKSTNGVSLGNEMEIDGYFFLSILNGNDVIRVNPSLKDEFYVDADKLKKMFASEIQKVQKEMIK